MGLGRDAQKSLGLAVFFKRLFNGRLFNPTCRNSKLYATARQPRKLSGRLGSSHPHTARL